MWRLKLKETLERFTVLDCKNWTCGGTKIQQQNISSVKTNSVKDDEKPQGTETKQNQCLIKFKSNQSDFGPEIFFARWTTCNSKKYSSSGSSNGSQKERNRKKISDSDNQLDDILGAITWSGAIVCGWYASQILCLRRRHLGWGIDSKNDKYLKYLQIPTRAIHSNLTSHLVYASPISPSLQQQQQPLIETLTLFSENVHQEEISDISENNNFSVKEHPSRKVLFEISNSTESSYSSSTSSAATTSTTASTSTTANSTSSCSTASSSSPPSSKKQTISEAVSELVKFIADYEYKVALEYIDTKDYRNAAVHLKLATNHRHPSGIFNLGVFYEKGLGVRKNLDRAMECYQLAANLGHPKAMFNLGIFYGRGLGGLQKDESTARKCIITAAKLGQPEAKLFLKKMSISVEEITKFPIYEKSRSASGDSGQG